MKRNNYIVASAGSFLQLTVFLIISALSESLIRVTGSAREFRGFWTNELFDQVSFFYSLIILFSLTGIFALNNIGLKTDFFNRNSKIKKLNFALKNPTFWIEYAVFTLLSVLFFMLLPFSNLTTGFFSHMSRTNGELVAIAITIPTIFAIKLIAYISTFNWWTEENKKKKFKDNRKPFISLIIQLGFSSLIYIFGGFAATIAFTMFSTAISIFAAIKFSIILTITLIIFSVLLIIYLIKQTEAVRQRYSMLKKVKSLGKKAGFSLELCAKPYSSSSLPDNAYNFIIRMNNRNIACRFVSSINKSIPVYLHENGTATYVHHKILYKHLVSEKYAFDAAEKVEKFIIVCPCNGNIFIKNDREERLSDVGDKCMEYKIYNSSGFINALERGYL